MKQFLQSSKIVGEEIVFEKKWFGISHVSYTIGEKVFHNYECCYRPTRKQRNLTIDGVEVVPIIKYSNKCPQLLLIANFRPPVGKFILQFPAGMLEDQDYEANARRQLEEQTGYVAEKIIKLHPAVMHCDPWKSNQSGLLYLALINGDKENKKQDLDSSENIRILKIPIDKDIMCRVNEIIDKNNYGIHTKVWSFLIGFNLTKLI